MQVILWVELFQDPITMVHKIQKLDWMISHEMDHELFRLASFRLNACQKQMRFPQTTRTYACSFWLQFWSLEAFATLSSFFSKFAQLKSDSSWLIRIWFYVDIDQFLKFSGRNPGKLGKNLHMSNQLNLYISLQLLYKRYLIITFYFH